MDLLVVPILLTDENNICSYIKIKFNNKLKDEKHIHKGFNEK